MSVIHRWKATVQYRTEHGTLDLRYGLEEIMELHALVERGPHWDTIIRIEIVRANHVTDPSMTVEGAERL